MGNRADTIINKIDAANIKLLERKVRRFRKALQAVLAVSDGGVIGPITAAHIRMVIEEALKVK